MVQIIPRAESTSDRFAKAFANLGQSAATEIPQAFLQRNEDRSLEQLIGKDLSNVRDPHMRQQFVNMALQKENQLAKMQVDSQAEEQNYEQIKEAFGEKFANVWKASSVGARTALEAAAIQQGLRKLPIGGLFGEDEGSTGKVSPKSFKNVIKTPDGQDFELPELATPEEMTPADRVKYQSTLRKENAPVFAESKNKLRGIKGERDRLDILENLNPKTPSGLSRFFYNKDGSIRPLAQVLKLVPKEAEDFVKTVNDFISSAKDIFGSRVTNYDIQVFKSRLPSLMNSQEARADIIKQMKIFNEMESNYYETLDKVYKKYGIGKISQEEAESITEQIIAPREAELRAELEQLHNKAFDLSEMPDASQYVGKIIEDDQGKRYRSNGFEWEPL